MLEYSLYLSYSNFTQNRDKYTARNNNCTNLARMRTLQTYLKAAQLFCILLYRNSIFASGQIKYQFFQFF